MRIHFVLLACIAPSLQAQAQTHGMVWQFGYDVGIDFHSCQPDVITGGNDGFEGCSAVSGPSGDLLFYTNGQKVWNRNHAQMPNGVLPIANSGSLSQVIIVQQPASENVFHIVTTTVQGTAAGHLRSHIVDMSAAGGYGDVVSAGNPLFPGGVSSEHVAATWHANGTDVWILAHAYPQNEFLAYLLTAGGLDPTPIVSTVGPAFPACGSNMNARGEMRFSLDGERLALAGNGSGDTPNSDVLALFTFNRATGAVSDTLLLPPSRGDFGVAFSPDGTKLYGGTWKAFNFFSTDHNYLYQFDLSSSDPQTIIDSRVVLLETPITGAHGSIKLGPDGRIYVARYAEGYLGVINYPNLPGLACNYEDDGLYLNGALCAHGFNNYIEYVNCEPIVTGSGEVEATAVQFVPNPSDGGFLITGLSTGARLMIHDAAGRSILDRTMSSAVNQSIDGLAPGGYLATVADVDGNVISRQRILVVR
ncbi:MAG: hypothetical protein IPK70_05930 [Flavobacteriales bacterium]|nr:hypothetical protein [Flavobacteriales bacterium]